MIEEGQILAILRQSHARGWMERLLEGGLTRAEARRWMWRACGQGAVEPLTEEILIVLLDDLLALDFEGAIAMARRLEGDHVGGRWHEVTGWREDRGRILEALAAQEPEALREALGDMSGVLLEQAEVALVLAGQLDAPSMETAVSLARSHLNDYGVWVEERWDRLGPPSMWEGAKVESLRRFGVRHWGRVGEALSALDDEELVVLATRFDSIYERSSGRARLTAEILRRGPTILPAAMSRVAESRGRLLGGLTALLEREGVPIPTAFDEVIAVELGVMDPDAPSGALHLGAMDADEVEGMASILRRLPPERANDLIRRALGSVGYRVQEVHGVNPESSLYDLVFKAIEADVYDSAPRRESWARGFAQGGARALEPLTRALEGKIGARRAIVVVMALGLIGGEGAAAGLQAGLEQSAKTTREVAAEQLILLGDAALNGIEASLAARKADVRRAALRVVEALGPSAARDAAVARAIDICRDAAIVEALKALPRENAEASLLSQLVDLELAIKGERMPQLLELWHQWRHSPTRPADQELLDGGVDALAAYTPWQHGGQERVDQALWVRALSLHKAHPLTPWIGLRKIDALPPKQLDAYLAMLADLFGGKLTEPIRGLMASASNRAPLYTLTGEVAPEEGVDILLAGLDDQSKPGCEAAVEALRAVGAIAPILPILKDGRKATRIAAARAIEGIGDPEAADALAQALDDERLGDVANALRRALEVCRPSDDVDLSTLDDPAIDAWLAARHAPRLPSFIDPDRLPEVRFATGSPLSLAAHHGLLEQLSLESVEHVNDEIRVIRGRLDRESLQGFGLAVDAAWREAGGPSRYAWAQEQMAICAGPALVDAWGREDVEGAYNQDRRRFKALAGFLSRHGSTAALSWLHLLSQRRFGASSARVLREHLSQRLTHLGAVPGQIRQHINSDLAEESRDSGATYMVSESQGGAWRREIAGCRVTFQMHPVASPEPCALTPRLLVRIESVEALEGDEGALPDHARRHAESERHQLQHQVDTATRRVRALIQAARERGRRWTPEGWRRLFVQTSPVAMLTHRLLFITTRGFIFGQGDDGLPRAPDGRPIAFFEDELIGLLAAEDAPPEALDAWTEATEGRAARVVVASSTEDLSAQDGLSELRGLLHDTPGPAGWEAIVSLLDAWPDESVAVPIGYALGHLERWREVERPTPRHWLAPLMSPSHPWRLEATLEGLLTTSEPEGAWRDQPRLSLCNTLTLAMKWARLDGEDLSGLTTSENMSSIRHIHIEYAAMDGENIEALARLAGLPSLSAVSLFGLRVSAPHLWSRLFGVLAGAPGLKRLTLKGLSLQNSHLTALIESGAIEGLEHLDLSLNNLGTDGVRALSQCEAVSGLKGLALDYNRSIAAEGAAILANASVLAGLQRLTLEGCAIFSKGEGALRASTVLSEAVRRSFYA